VIAVLASAVGYIEPELVVIGLPIAAFYLYWEFGARLSSFPVEASSEVQRTLSLAACRELSLSVEHDEPEWLGASLDGQCLYAVYGRSQLLYAVRQEARTGVVPWRGRTNRLVEDHFCRAIRRGARTSAA
jgi:hypothetical protein